MKLLIMQSSPVSYCRFPPRYDTIYDMIFVYYNWVSTRWQLSVDLYKNRRQLYTWGETIHKILNKTLLTYSMEQSPS